jgi:alpha-beta hydrolase superfamily lysophospholipase
MSKTHDLIPCRTRDGLKLGVRRIPSTTGKARAAVVMQHGLGSNGLAFDYPGHSFAQALARAGFDCYISELRGAGDSDHPGEPFGIDDYLDSDLPAIIDAVRGDSGRERISWVGHSMGGILMMMYGIDHPDAPIERFVAIGSSLDYRPGRSVFRELRKARVLAGNWLKFYPFDVTGRANALVAGRGPVLPPEGMNFWRSNMDRRVMRGVLARGFTAIPIRLFDDLNTTFDDAGFSRQAGRITYLPRAAQFKIPTCLMMGTRDVQALEIAVEATARRLSGVSGLSLVGLGKKHGQADEYGHIDLLVGRRAPSEVWPAVARFLQGPA